MKRFAIGLMVLLMLMVGKEAKAIEMPDMSINSAFLYSLETKTFTVAPLVDATLATALDEVLRFNVGAAFPDSDKEELREEDVLQGNFVGGPLVKVDIVKLLGKIPQITIIKTFNLEAGIGLFADITHIKGLAVDDLKKIIYPTFALGFRF
uniref:Uncharacterized protein n=1 Tax=viral metagenome TaxID=1070528 RepID=A0A6H1ZAT6_9ZZZZ